MDDIKNIENIILEYIDEASLVIKESKPLAGIFGLKGGAGDDPCHRKFYSKLESALKEGTYDSYEVVKLLVNADKTYDCHKTIKLMLTAIQGLAIPFASTLTDEQKQEFLTYFDENVKRKDRVPVQDQLIKALKK